MTTHYTLGDSIDPATADLDALARDGLVMTPRGKVGVVVPCEECETGCFWCGFAGRLIHFGGTAVEPLHDRVVP